MKIKPRNKATRKTREYHYWLAEEPPKKTGRLAQLNKHNHRTPSEFILMAQAIEDEPYRIPSK